ncbi:RHS repeat-associated core domain-containing protein [Lentisphaerota bacterium WC36G]|nr:RHS repeat-associated core domain-containing protein [Lentisphaerae bacterium WC36]
MLLSDNLLALEKDGVVFNYIADGNKNITQLIDLTTGEIANKYDYSPFGQLAKTDENVENVFKFSSEYAEKETGLIYYNYRYYNPSTGKWINRDPIQEKGGTNLYGFVVNKPVNYSDDLGLSSYLSWKARRELEELEKEEKQKKKDEKDTKSGCCGSEKINRLKQCCKGGKAKDKFIICIMVQPAATSGSVGHAWIYVVNLRTKEKHTHANYRNGLKDDLDLNSKKTGKIIKKCATICDFKKTTPPPYDGVTSNCATYAINEWNKHTGENISGTGTPEYDSTGKDNLPPDNLMHFGRHFTPNPSSLSRNITNQN